MAEPFDDIIDELEAEVLGPQAPAAQMKAAAEKVKKAEEEAMTESKNPLISIFMDKDIRIVGTIKDPLFCAADVGRYIGDDNYFNALKNYNSAATAKTGVFVHKIDAKDRSGNVKRMLFLSENGLYRYLLRSDKERAADFQAYTYDILRVERDRVVDAVQLALKIQRDTYATQLQDANALRHIARSDADRAMRVANDLRAELRKTRSQVAKKEEAAWNKEHARLLALEEENRTRGPFESAHRF